jgi:hypothetical protein
MIEDDRADSAPERMQRVAQVAQVEQPPVPSPTLSPTHPVPRGLLNLCPSASSGPQGLHTAYIQPIYGLYAAYIRGARDGR